MKRLSLVTTRILCFRGFIRLLGGRRELSELPLLHRLARYMEIWEVLVLFVGGNGQEQLLQPNCFRCQEPPDRLRLLDIVIGDNNEVDGDSGEDDGTANACLHGRCNHWDKSDEDGAEDVDYWEDEIDLDWPFPLRVLPSKVGQAEDGESN